MNRQILEEASTWFIEFRAGPMSPATQAQFVHWLTLSPEHIRAYLEISGTYTQVPKAGEVSDEVVANLLRRARARLEDSVTPFSEPGSTSISAVPEHGSLSAALTRVRAPHGRAWAFAVMILLTVGVAATWFYWQRGLYTTEIAEQRTVTLEDGSRIELNARSRVRVRYSKSARSVELLAGQALFQVAKDPGRPFLVYSADATVRAVGTQFDVDRKGDDTTVTVVEGRVAVYAPEVSRSAGNANPPQNGKEGSGTPLSRSPDAGSHLSGLTSLPPRQTFGTAVSIPNSEPSNAVLDPSGSAAIFLSAGEQLIVTPHIAASPQRANVSATTAWTRGQLEFEETPLPEVAEEFNRYSPRRLIIESPDLKSFKVSGVYSSADTEALILFLRNQPDLVVNESGGEVRIRSK